SYEGEQEPRIVDEFEGKTGKIFMWEEDGSVVTWEFVVPETGLYLIGVEYYQLPGRRSAMQRDFKVNGEYQYNELRRITFERVWADSGFPRRDNRGNDVRPSHVEAPEWQFKYIEEPEGLYYEPLFVKFEEGVNRITLSNLRDEPMAVRRIVI